MLGGHAEQGPDVCSVQLTAVLDGSAIMFLYSSVEGQGYTLVVIAANGGTANYIVVYV